MEPLMGLNRASLKSTLQCWVSNDGACRHQSRATPGSHNIQLLSARRGSGKARLAQLLHVHLVNKQASLLYAPDSSQGSKRTCNVQL